MYVKNSMTIVFIFLISILSYSQQKINFLEPNEKNINFKIEGVPFQIGQWEDGPYGSNAISDGNHRAVIKTSNNSEAVYVKIPWRRHDPKPAEKAISIKGAKSGIEVNDYIIKSCNNEFGEIVFKPLNDEDEYYVYYFPYETTGGYYPVVNYLKPGTKVSSGWMTKYENINTDELSQGKIVSIQSRNKFNSFFPMEIISSSNEKNKFLELNDKSYFIFPEFRDNPIKLKHYLPYHWCTRELKNGLIDDVKKGEYYTFQLGLYSNTENINNVKIEFENLKSGKNIISKESLTCFNSGGTNYTGENLDKVIKVAKGDIQALWIGVDIPENISSGIYEGIIIVKPENLIPDTIYLKLNLSEDIIKDKGDDTPELMSRLRWLNSKLGTDNNFVIDPFIPVAVNEKVIQILGRDVKLNEFGLPAQINSYFSDDNTQIGDEANPLLENDFLFNISSQQNISQWVHKPFKIKKIANGLAEWISISENNYFTLQVKGKLEYDGMLELKLNLFAKKDINIDDISLDILMDESSAKYMLGLGYKGGKLPKNIDWKWDVKNHQEGAWIGTINKGMQYVLRDENYERPLNTNFYHSKPLNLPSSWYNAGKGGIKINKLGTTTKIHNYSGNRLVKTGDVLHFNCRLLITPFKPIDFKNHFETRFVHKYVPIDSAFSWGGTVINVHHANEINPYINYPFHNLEAQKQYIDEAHEKGIKVKLYNTIRELTYKTHEIFAFRSLGDEIFNDGEGGGHPWLQEHLEDNYHKAWHAWGVDDASILNKGTSRWTNYYIEGLNWLAKNQEIDGLYLDDVAFNRETVKRMVSVLNTHRNEVVIDLHSANQFNEKDGFINSAFLYMEHFPYISRLWFGEYFEYDLNPDYWLTEISGIPFGLTGEMLQDCGSPYRGLIYGMTTRVYGNCDPRPLWKEMDDFGIANSKFYAYWQDDSPVTINNDKLKLATFRNENELFIVIASWSEVDESVELVLSENLYSDNKPQKAIAPFINDMQNEQIINLKKPVIIPANTGLIMKIKL